MYRSVFVVTALLVAFNSQGLAQKRRVPVDTVTAASARKSDLFSRDGSVDIIGEGRMNKGLVINSLGALSGQAAGVNISSVGNDRMAMLNSVRVRGTTSLTGGNDPLVIIDGVYSDIATLNSIYPADIESFAILKNAAETSPYGSRGASGVIIVTTKKGHGAKFHISYDGNIGFESVSKNMKMLSADAYRTTAQQLGISYNDGGFNTNFPNAITRTGFIQNHHVAFSGGSETANYRASVAYMSHNTIIQLHGENNFVAKMDLQQKAFDNLLGIDFGVFGSSMNADHIFDYQKLFYSAAAQNPTFPAGRDANGGWNRNGQASQIATPGALLLEQDRDKLLNFISHMQLSFHLSPAFSLSAFGSYSYNSTGNAQYLPTWIWAQGQAYRSEMKTEDWLANIKAVWNKSFGETRQHHLAGTLLGEYQKRTMRRFFTTAKGFKLNQHGYDNLAAGSILPYGGTGSSYENPAMTSLMGEVEYSYANTVTFTANARADGSSMFAHGNKWGLFPSVAVKWNVLQMFRNMSLPLGISKFEVRTSYGLTGNTGGITSYNSLPLLNPTGLISWNGNPTTTMGITSNVNPDLKWETRSSFNIGADIALWNGRVVLTTDYYYSLIRHMLYMYDVPVPPFVFNKLLANLGSMRNKGLEIGIGITPVQRRNVELNVNINASFQSNKLLSLSGNYQGNYLSASEITPVGNLNGAGFHGGDNNIVYQIIGQPLGVFYLPHCTGLKKGSDGRLHYEIADLDNDGTINLADGKDRYIAGQATPKMTLGSNISLRIHNFDIALQMNGAFGHKIYNGSSLTYMNMRSFPDYNVLATAPAKNIGDQVATDYWLESGNYLNFNYLTIGWNVPTRRLSRAIAAMRLSLSVNNLATITAYSGLTPMINSYVSDGTLGIDDKRSYPPYRSFSAGFSIQF